MTALDVALWHLTGALRNAQLHRRAFCHARRYPRRGVWVDGTRWPDLDPETGCLKCYRTLRRVSYAYTLAYVLCRQERRYLKALTFEQRYGGPAVRELGGQIGTDLHAAVEALVSRPAYRPSVVNTPRQTGHWAGWRQT